MRPGAVSGHRACDQQRLLPLPDVPKELRRTRGRVGNLPGRPHLMNRGTATSFGPLEIAIRESGADYCAQERPSVPVRSHSART